MCFLKDILSIEHDGIDTAELLEYDQHIARAQVLKHMPRHLCKINLHYKEVG